MRKRLKKKMSKPTFGRSYYRWQLVHSAGCAVSNCASKSFGIVLDNISGALEHGASVPRSYRNLLRFFAPIKLFEPLPWTDDTKGPWFERLDAWFRDQKENHGLVDLKTFLRSPDFGDEPCSLEAYCEQVYKVVTGYYPSVDVTHEVL